MLSVELLKRTAGLALDVTWQAREGIVALCGPAGSGKSLTLRCLAGLTRPDGGSISLAGRALFDATKGIDVPVRDRRVGVVFPGPGAALFPHLTVWQNVRFGLARFPRAERRRRSDELLAQLGLSSVQNRLPRDLTRGEQQRAGLARALAPDPALLLIGEPLAALDESLRHGLEREFAALVRAWGRTTVVVTHDVAQAWRLTNQVIHYRHGRIVQPENPAPAFTLDRRSKPLRWRIHSAGPRN